MLSSLLFRWSACISYGSTMLLATVVLYQDLPGMVISPALFILFWIDLAMLGLLCFHVDFIIAFCIPVKNVIGLFIGIASSCRLLLAMQPFSQYKFCCWLSMEGLSTLRCLVSISLFSVLFLSIFKGFRNSIVFPISFSACSLST